MTYLKNFLTSSLLLGAIFAADESSKIRNPGAHLTPSQKSRVLAFDLVRKLAPFNVPVVANVAGERFVTCYNPDDYTPSLLSSIYSEAALRGLADPAKTYGVSVMPQSTVLDLSNDYVNNYYHHNLSFGSFAANETTHDNTNLVIRLGDHTVVVYLSPVDTICQYGEFEGDKKIEAAIERLGLNAPSLELAARTYRLYPKDDNNFVQLKKQLSSSTNPEDGELLKFLQDDAFDQNFLAAHALNMAIVEAFGDEMFAKDLSGKMDVIKQGDEAQIKLDQTHNLSPIAAPDAPLNAEDLINAHGGFRNNAPRYLKEMGAKFFGKKGPKCQGKDIKEFRIKRLSALLEKQYNSELDQHNQRKAELEKRPSLRESIKKGNEQKAKIVQFITDKIRTKLPGFYVYPKPTTAQQSDDGLSIFKSPYEMARAFMAASSDVKKTTKSYKNKVKLATK